jgi:uncharacterized protein (DUF58 family)
MPGARATRSSSYGALLEAVRGVHWPARRRIASAAPGTHPSTVRGTSAEFDEYRLYRQGDDPRRLDWRVLARSDRAYVRLATDHTVLPTTIVLDATSSMAFPVSTREKWTFAQSLAVGLAAVAHGDGDPVGLIVAGSDGGPRALPPRTRRGIVSEIARAVDDADPDGAAPLAPAVASIRAGRIVLITDLLGDADDLLRAARVHAAAGREVCVVHVIAREELEPPRRTLLAADPEAPAIQRLLVDSTRRAYDSAFAEWRADMARRCRAGGAAYVAAVSDEDPARMVRRVALSADAASGGSVGA